MHSEQKRIRNVRIAIYFDSVLGIVCGITAFLGIFFYTQQEGIVKPIIFTLGIIFWSSYLGLSIFMIGLGIYTYYREKNFDPDAIPKEKLRAPIV